MKRKRRTKGDTNLLRNYDFSKGAHGKYAARYVSGNNLAIISQDVAKMFPDSASVNEALRNLVKIARRVKKAA